MRRGEIYYIQRRDTVGHEIAKSRPAVIVSNDNLNACLNVVEVVYLTTAPKQAYSTHVRINSTGRPSIALCENIDCVDKSLVGDYCGRCTAQEMEELDEALLCSLGLSRTEPAPSPEQQYVSPDEEWLTAELGRVTAERDRYAKMVDLLMGVAEK